MRRPLPRVPHKPLGEKAREYYRYERERARGSNPATPAKTPTTPAKKPTKQAAKALKPARSTRAATPKQKPAKRRTKPKQRTTSQRDLQRDTTVQRLVARSIMERKNPAGYADKSPAYLLQQVKNKKNWKEECEAGGIDPETVKPPSRDTLARMIGRRRA